MKKKIFCMALLCLLCWESAGCNKSPEEQPAAPLLTPPPATAFVCTLAAASTPAPTLAPAPSPSPTPTPSPSPTPTPSGLCGGRYPEAFSYEGTEITDMSYRDGSLSVTVTVYRNPEGFDWPLTYFIADIYLQDLSSFQSPYAGKSPLSGDTLSPTAFCENTGAVLAVNGDYAAARKTGLIVRNGEVFLTKDTARYDYGLITKDGELLTFFGGDYSCEELLSAYDVAQAWCFGPALLDESGQPLTSFHSSLTGVNPRTVLGYYEPGHYCIVVIDGRQPGYSLGLTMKDTARLMASLGCKTAYNLDGGGSSILLFMGKVINSPSSRRNLTDMVCICPLGD